MKRIDTRGLDELFQLSKYKDVDQIGFIENGIELDFVYALLKITTGMSINTSEGNFPIPSEEGNWALYQLVRKEITKIAEREEMIEITFENGFSLIITLDNRPNKEKLYFEAGDGINQDSYVYYSI